METIADTGVYQLLNIEYIIVYSNVPIIGNSSVSIINNDYFLNINIVGNLGCTDSLAFNYDSIATFNDGSCQYYTTTCLPDSRMLMSVGPFNFNNNDFIHGLPNVFV